MRTFRDKKNREWQVDITVGHMLDIKSRLGLNLLDNLDDMPSDWESTINVLWIVCEDQAIERGVDDRAFGRLMAAETINEATDALMEELIDFFSRLQPERGKLLRVIWDRTKRWQEGQEAAYKKARLSLSTDSPGLSA